ncbi:PREDICTED: B9 domain-containing protein 2 [Bactrocera latifrons]|uniref:B9 domain-containing protein 2 n=1 Tax=Bactrocera latifrons TaxID=174628 RepID=UPI0008DE9FC5|nr:PREDICTED: B9 domain-containing protein 2 [Bactrocera latifrons]
MAEVHVIGQILKAVDFAEPHLYCKWSLQSGSAWRLVQGEVAGQTLVSSNRLEQSSDFAHPLDIHLATASIQGWPKLHVEVYAVNVLQKSWPVGYGFLHIPSRPGVHRLELLTWKVAPLTWWDSVREKFGGGGVGLSKADLIYTGVERYKLQTRSSGKIIIDLNLVFRNFAKFGVEFK